MMSASFPILVWAALSFVQAAAASPSDGFRRGQELFREGDYDAALEVLARTVEELDAAQERLEARITLARIHQSRGDDERAVLELQWLLADAPGFELDGDVYSPKTVALFERARVEAPGRLESARKAFAEGRFDRALREFELSARLLRSRVGAAEAVVESLLSAALIQQTLGNVERSRERFRAALVVDPELRLDPAVHAPSTIELFEAVRGEWLERREGALSAKARLEAEREELHSLRPGSSEEGEIQAARGAEHFSAGRFEEASAAFEAAAEVYEGLSRRFTVEREAVLGVVEDFRRAIAERSLSDLEAIWPSLDDDTKRKYRDNFEFLREWKVDLRVTDIQLAEAKADVTCERRDIILPRGGVPVQKRSVIVFKLGKSSGSWLIEAI